MKFSILTAFLLGSLAITATAAAKKSSKVKESLIPVAAAYDIESPFLNEEYYQKKLKEAAARGKRNVAESTSDVPAIETQFSNDFLNLRSELIGGSTYSNGRPGSGTIAGVKTPEELDAVINKYADPKVYAGLSTQAQLVVLQLRALRPYKSIIFRAKDYIGKHTGVRSAIVTMLRNSAAGLQAYFPANGSTPVNQWEVVFKYLTEPMTGMGRPIQTDRDLYAVLTQINLEANAIVTDMVKIYNKNESIWWDNKLYMSFANFTSEKDRYVKLGHPEQTTMLAAGYMSLSGLNAVTAYSLDGLQEALRKTGNLFGIDVSTSFVSGRPASGMSSKQRFQILKDEGGLFVLTRDGAQRMKASYSSLVTAIRLSRSAWEEMKTLANSGRSDDFLFDPRVVIPFNRILGTSFDNVDELVAGAGARSTVINGEVIKVNLAEFYNNPPRALSELYPQRFDEGPDQLQKNIEGRVVPYRNYKQGSAVAWSLPAYAKYFPDAAPSKEDGRLTKDVPKYARVLSQSWGGAAFGLPLMSFIF